RSFEPTSQVFSEAPLAGNHLSCRGHIRETGEVGTGVRHGGVARRGAVCIGCWFMRALFVGLLALAGCSSPEQDVVPGESMATDSDVGGAGGSTAGLSTSDGVASSAASVSASGPASTATVASSSVSTGGATTTT